MGTVFSLDVREPGVPAEAITQAVELLHAIDARFSTYRDDSEVSRVNRGELSEADAGPELRWVLAECERWRQVTGGWFSARPAGALDPSGFVKGWAIQQVSDLLYEAGSRNHCVNGGGDVHTVGSPEPGRQWRVGIADPRHPGRLVTAIGGVGIAVATSGSAERGAHILDPHTGHPVDGSLLSVTVSSTSIVQCDVLATAAFAMGEAAADWLAEFRGHPRILAFGVRADGSTFSTRGPEPVAAPAR